MISVLMSEGLAPSNGAKSHEPTREASRPSKDEKFSSFLDSQDERSEVDPKQENEVAGAAGASAATDQTSSDSDKSSLTEAGRAASESSLANSRSPSAEEAAAAASARSSTEESTAAKVGLVESSDAAAINSARAAETETSSDTIRAQSNLDADATARASNAEADLAPRTGDSDPRLTANSDTGIDPKIDDSGVRAASNSSEDSSLKFADLSGQSSRDGQSQQSLATGDALSATESDIAADADKIATDELRTGELADLAARKQTSAGIGDEKIFQLNTAREAAPLTNESLLAVAPTSTPSTAAPVSTGGLAPTVPAHVIAAPNELTSVVMNALKNGGDVQEQLVVQLDPPELGRVLIDFKFDAQGLQQITVTSENPEALKRLRELHFELTEALKSQGFSDSNLSFQQEAQDQSQSNWQAREWGRAQSQVVAAAERSSSESAMPTPPNFTGRDRLDLLL